MAMRITVLMIGVLLRKKITCKFKLADSRFDGYLNPRVFGVWLPDMERYFDCYEMFDVRKIRFAGLRLVGPVRIYWSLIERARERQRKNPKNCGKNERKY